MMCGAAALVAQAPSAEPESFLRKELAITTGELASLEKDLKKRFEVHEAVIVTILQSVMDIIDPPVAPEPPKPRIGFTP